MGDERLSPWVQHPRPIDSIHPARLTKKRTFVSQDLINKKSRLYKDEEKEKATKLY